MSKLSNQWVDVFAAGDHGADKGGVFTEADLDRIIANLDPSFHEVPAVIGHPESDAPAYGWVNGLRRVGNLLQATFKDVVPAFEEAVKAGRFKKRSVSLYKGDKGWSLRHVGFLGAQPPQIKGLADIKFSNKDTKSIAIDFEESDMADETTLVDRIIAKFEERFGKKTSADETAIFTEAQARQIAEAAAAEAIKPLQTELAAQKALFAESARNATTADVKTRAATAIAKLKASGKWVPAFDKLGVPVLFEELARTTETVEFGEADSAGAKKKESPLNLLVEFMEQHKAIVPTSAVYTGQKGADAPAAVKGLNEGRYGANVQSVRFDEAIQARMKTDKIGYIEASTRVAQENPELAMPGASAAGAV